MAYKCGECLLFQGTGKCDGGKSTSSSNGMAASCSSFKAPSSFFDKKICGGCRLFNGTGKCDGGKSTSTNNGMAASCSSYAFIPG
jgi:hypothetical protein